ncbi:MAG: IS5 family transposase [Nitrospira sp.]|nr:IS5 family transposase [Nitrospira sp.]
MSKVAKSTEKAPKDQYKIVNWSSYNESLKNRGSLTLWIAEDCQEWWYDDGPVQRGGQYEYSDRCIECLIMLKVVFKLAYRQTQGFAESVLALLGLDLITPSYSQINRRARDLGIQMDVPANGSIHLVADSTGLKVFGEGEWKVRKHGYSKRRTWRKLHLGVDESTGMIHAVCLTKNDVDDAGQVEDLLDQVQVPVDTFSGDGAYDKSKCWDALKDRSINPVIPPREDAVYWLDEHGDMLDHPRNQILAHIDRFGRKAWKKHSHYHRRSLSETAMFRFKTIFGDKLYSKTFDRQQTEARIKTKALNIMSAQGMPVSVKVA